MNVRDTVHSHTFSWRDQTALRATGRERNGLDFLRAIASGELPAPAMLALLSGAIESVAFGRVVFTAEPGPYHANPLGTTHGGFACTLFDSALACAIQSTLDAGVGCATLDLHVRFTRALPLDIGVVRCVGETVHVGRSVATAEAKLYDLAGKLYGHATTSCAIVRS